MKKITLTLLALVCALCCALGLAACGEDAPKVNGIMIVPTGEQPDVTKQHDQVYTEITYGETPDLSFYKLYLYYGNGDTKELALSDEKLTAVYSYSGFNSTESKTMEKLPDEWIAGNYSIAYTYDGKSDSQYKATALINVNWSQSGAFSVQPTKSTWAESEKSPNVILKNPKGVTVTTVDSINAVEKSDDSDGCYYLRYVEKQVYDAFTEAQKTDYEFLESCSDVHTYVADIEGYLVGEYMLFAMIDRTYNYDSVVTPAVKITVTAPSNEVTAEEWKQLIEGITNVTVVMGDNSFKSDGTSMLLITADSEDSSRSIMTKDGDKYYMYVLTDNAWNRSEVTSNMYNQAINGFSEILSAFSDDYTSFTYADGKYTCASLDKTQSFGATFTDIEVVFENDALISIKFNTPDGLYEIKEIGTTTVEIPTTYTESNN